MEKNSKAIADSTEFSVLNEQYYNLSNQYQRLSDNYRELSKSYRKELAALEKNYQKLKKSNSKLLLREFLYKKTFEDDKEAIGQLKAQINRLSNGSAESTLGGKVLSFFAGLFIGAIGVASSLYNA